MAASVALGIGLVGGFVFGVIVGVVLFDEWR